MEKDLTHKIVLRKGFVPEIMSLLELNLVEKETYQINDKPMEKRHLYSSLSYSFE
jgi:hypothetical protein